MKSKAPGSSSSENLAIAEEKHQLVDGWQLPKDGEQLYTVDAVIEAYIKGKSEGEEQTKKLLVKQFSDNMHKAGNHTAKVLEFLKEHAVTYFSAHLKSNSFDDFCVVVTVTEEDFLKNIFQEVYQFTSNLEGEVREEFYNISFSFINKSSKFNVDMLSSDGYFFSYKEK